MVMCTCAGDDDPDIVPVSRPAVLGADLPCTIASCFFSTQFRLDELLYACFQLYSASHRIPQNLTADSFHFAFAFAEKMATSSSSVSSGLSRTPKFTKRFF